MRVILKQIEGTCCTYLPDCHCHLLQLIRADVWTKCEAKVDQGKFAQQIPITERPPMLINQVKWPTNSCLAGSLCLCGGSCTAAVLCG